MVDRIPALAGVELSRGSTRLNDLQFPATELQTLREVAELVRKGTGAGGALEPNPRGSAGEGTCAFFVGGSQSSRTLAAEAVANELRRDLYRVNLTALVSQYIGETEKNLRRLFDAAEKGSAILLFDEADALFGRRSEVKDSHDRYASIEVEHLLQLMNDYPGLVVLSGQTQEGFDRRLLACMQFMLPFPSPGSDPKRPD